MHVFVCFFNASPPVLSPALCVRFMTKRFIGEYDNKKGEITVNILKGRIIIVLFVFALILSVCVNTEVTYRSSRVVDQEAVEVEILDIACKVCLTASFCLCDLEVVSKAISLICATPQCMNTLYSTGVPFIRAWDSKDMLRSDIEDWSAKTLVICN